MEEDLVFVERLRRHEAGVGPPVAGRLARRGTIAATITSRSDRTRAHTSGPTKPPSDWATTITWPSVAPGRGGGDGVDHDVGEVAERRAARHPTAGRPPPCRDRARESLDDRMPEPTVGSSAGNQDERRHARQDDRVHRTHRRTDAASPRTIGGRWPLLFHRRRRSTRRRGSSTCRSSTPRRRGRGAPGWRRTTTPNVACGCAPGDP